MGMLMFRRFLILIAFSILIVAGCGDSGPKMARVEGTVTYDGKPLSAATIIFTPESGARMGEGGTDEQGHYYLGTYKIDDGAIVWENIGWQLSSVGRIGLRPRAHLDGE